MRENMNLEIMLKKYDHLHFRYENLIKNRQTCLFITLLTSAFYLVLVQFYFRYEISMKFFPLILIPAFMIIALWIQNLLFFLPYRFTKRIDYIIYEKEYLNIEKLMTDKEIIDFLKHEFKNLYHLIGINSQRIKSYQLFLTITWLVLILATIFPLYLLLFF